MYFVLKQHQELGRTFDVNVRLGGFKTKKAAFGMAKRQTPAIVKDETRNIVAQTISPTLKGFIS